MSKKTMFDFDHSDCCQIILFFQYDILILLYIDRTEYSIYNPSYRGDVIA